VVQQQTRSKKASAYRTNVGFNPAAAQGSPRHTADASRDPGSERGGPRPPPSPAIDAVFELDELDELRALLQAQNAAGEQLDTPQGDQSGGFGAKASA